MKRKRTIVKFTKYKIINLEKKSRKKQGEGRISTTYKSHRAS